MSGVVSKTRTMASRPPIGLAHLKALEAWEFLNEQALTQLLEALIVELFVPV